MAGLAVMLAVEDVVGLTLNPASGGTRPAKWILKFGATSGKFRAPPSAG